MPEANHEREGKVVKVLSDFKIVVNLGSQHDIGEHDQFIIYELGEEIFDPDNRKSLGKVEIVKGIGKVSHVQAAMSTLVSCKTQEVPVEPKSFGLLGSVRYETKLLPFDQPAIGDRVRLRRPF